MTFAEQALANLVGNALRHNRPDGHAVVVLDVVGDESVLRVLDDGPGLDDEERARVQKRGERGERLRGRVPHRTDHDCRYRARG
jgi:signal transduction histidine kinase